MYMKWVEECDNCSAQRTLQPNMTDNNSNNNKAH